MVYEYSRNDFRGQQARERTKEKGGYGPWGDELGCGADNALHKAPYQKLRRGQRGGPSAQAQARHTGPSAYGWLDYAMIRRRSRRCRFR